MGIISYAQNFEDVMLWRALKDVENGFYIDIGANHPNIDSVTKLFYDNGWCGINVEPELELYELLKEERTRDINLNIAISSQEDSIDFYVSKTRGWSTTDKKSAKNLENKDSFLEKRTVKAMSLDALCDEYNVQEVHFLKVDVEGAERDVLQSFSFKKTRPWICVVEATKPTTQVDISNEWEYILLENDYEYVYFDGLNKYYVSKEHADIVNFFSCPPNVFDEFTLIATVEAKAKAHEWWEKATEAEAKATQAEQRATEAEAKATQAEQRATEAEAKASQAEQEARNAWHHYHLVVNSNSWKLTYPLREARRGVKWFTTGVYHWITFSPTSRPRRVTKKVLLKLKHHIEHRPKLKREIVSLLNRFPFFKKKLKNFLGFEVPVENNHFSTTISDLEDCQQLSPQAQTIYKKLKEEIQRQRGKK